MLRSRRGEAQVEYVIIGVVVTTCAVTGLLVAGAGGLRTVADASRLCVVEAGECDKVDTGEHDPLQDGERAESEAEEGAEGEDAEAEGEDAEAQGEDVETPETGEDELLGPRVEKLNPDGTIKDGLDGSAPSTDDLTQLGPLKLTPPPAPVDPFGLKSLFGSALSTGYGQSLYQSFQGILGWFTG